MLASSKWPLCVNISFCDDFCSLKFISFYLHQKQILAEVLQSLLSVHPSVRPSVCLLQFCNLIKFSLMSVLKDLIFGMYVQLYIWYLWLAQRASHMPSNLKASSGSVIQIQFSKRKIITFPRIPRHLPHITLYVHDTYGKLTMFIIISR